MSLPAGVGILSVDHVGLAVPDLDTAIAFHTGVLGGRLAHREENAEQGVAEAMIAYGSGAQVQLLAPLTPASTIAKFLDRSGPGLQQLAYRVADIDAACAAVRAAGLRLLFDGPRRGTADSRINFIHPKDAGGVLVELVEPAAVGPGGHTTATAVQPPEVIDHSDRPGTTSPVGAGVDGTLGA